MTPEAPGAEGPQPVWRGGDRRPARRRIRRAYLLVVAVTMGALVMALEVLGTRVIGTIYGSSLYVWAALISVTLVSLAVGYFTGGLLADKAPKGWLLYATLMLGGVCTLVLPHLRGLMLPCYRALGLQWGALASAALLFFLPLFLLGMTGPFVIRLLSEAVERSGRTAGAVYALSTLGSVAGTLGVAFYVIPAVGSPMALRLVGACVVVICAVGLAVELGARWLPLVLLASPAFWGGWPQRERRIPLPPAGEDKRKFDIIYRDESPYGRLAVLESADERLLLADGILQTGVPHGHYTLERGRMLSEQGYYLELLPYLVEEAEGKRACVIGLAGGLLPQLLELHGIEAHAVEIDAKMARIARRFFGYAGPLTIQDGRRFIEDTVRQFNFCVIDAYSSDVLPFHLVTREMFQAVRRALVRDGILAVHLIAAPKGWVAASVYRTLRAAFPCVWAYRCADDEEVQNLFYFAAATEPPISRRWVFDVPSDEGVPAFWSDLQRRRLDLASAGGIVLTDEYNPVDLARAPEALQWRETTIRKLGMDALTH